MGDKVSPDERSYRRGVILGLTMAEVVILLLFALLLVWTSGIQNESESDRRSKDLKQKVDELEKRVSGLKGEINYLAGGEESGNQFDDLFRELKPTQGGDAASEKSPVGLQDTRKQADVPGGSPEQI